MSEEPVKVKVKRKIIEGVSYFLDAENILYNPQTKAEVGLWDEESQTIKPLPEEDDDEEDDEDDENTDVVTRIEFEGKKYLKSKKTGVIYNLDKEVIGKWNEAKNRIDFDEPDSEDDDEEDDDELPDDNEGLFYLSKSAEYFDKKSFDTGIRLSNGFTTEDIVKLNAYLMFGVMASVETNGIVRLWNTDKSRSQKYGGQKEQSYLIDFVGKDGKIRKGKIHNPPTEIIGIYDGTAFVALFDYSKKHTTLETYDRRIVNAFRDYILPKIIFMKPERLYNYKQKPLKLPPLEKALDDAKKDLEAETDPAIQKVIRSLMKKIISSITKAIEFDEAEIAKKEKYDALDVEIKRKNKEMLAEQKIINDRMKAEAIEAKRLGDERRQKEKEERDAKAAEEKRKLDAKNAYKALPQQTKNDMKFLDHTKYELNKLTFYDNMVTEGRTIHRVPTPVSSMGVKKYLELQELLTELNKRPDMSFPAGYNEYGGTYEGVDSQTLRANIEEALARYKMSFIVNIFNELREPRNMVKQPERWISFDETTKKGLKKKAEFVAEAEKRIKEYSDLLDKYASKDERDQAIDIVNQQIRDERAGKTGSQALYNRLKASQEEKTGVGLKGMKNEDEKRQEVMKYSDPKKALENAVKYLKKDVIFSLSTKPKKKYMVMNPDTMKWTHFGEIGYEDFTKHNDPIRRQAYLKRTANMKGNWKNDKYSANNLARNILW